MLLGLLFPRRCLGCGQPGGYFCSSCRPKIKPLLTQICPVCQKAAISGKTHVRCQTKLSLDGLISLFSYEGIMQKAIKKLKYRLVTDLAEELASLAVAFRPSIFNRQSLFLVPVPLHPRRQRQRGFNQAELLGQILAKKFDWSVQTELLVRSRSTKPQVSLRRRERWPNIRGAFKLNPRVTDNLKSATHLIFDDVWTTGSTLKECGRVLKRNGVKQVWGLTVAK